MDWTQWLQMAVTILCSTVASGGFWSYIQKRRDTSDVRTKMLLGLGHDKIIYLGMQFIERGYVSQDEYENLIKYLYEPYKELGGNGTAARIIDDVKKLPIKRQSQEV